MKMPKSGLRKGRPMPVEKQSRESTESKASAGLRGCKAKC